MVEKRISHLSPIGEKLDGTPTSSGRHLGFSWILRNDTWFGLWDQVFIKPRRILRVIKHGFLFALSWPRICIKTQDYSSLSVVYKWSWIPRTQPQRNSTSARATARQPTPGSATYRSQNQPPTSLQGNYTIVLYALIIVVIVFVLRILFSITAWW